jgi:hypothetical protein
MTRLGLTRLERGAAALVAGLLLLLQAAIPPGFMLASGGATPTGAPSIVICTGHGPLAVSGDVPGPDGAKSPKSSPGAHAACPFAGHTGASVIPEPVQPQAVAYGAFAGFAPRATALAPGRGLAAPPPPATGPPTVLI